MVRLIFVAFLLLSTCCHAQLFETKITIDHIRIDQVGPRDAMLEPIIITTEKLELRFPERPIQVRKNIFESLSNYIDKAYIDKAHNLLRKRERNEFGVFKVTKRIGSKTEIYFTGTRKKSVDFLSEFKKLLKDVGAPDELVKKNERILKRIDY
jgi:hypothetical protein